MLNFILVSFLPHIISKKILVRHEKVGSPPGAPPMDPPLIKKTFNCNSKMMIYLTECQISGEQYTGDTETKFPQTVNDYCRHWNVCKEQNLSNQAPNENVLTNIIFSVTLMEFVTDKLHWQAMLIHKNRSEVKVIILISQNKNACCFWY